MSAEKDKIANYYKHYIEQYIETIVKGLRLVCKTERLMVERHLTGLEDKDSAWEFNWQYALRPLVWMAENLVFPEGDKKGKIFKLEPWQAFIVSQIFGWIEKETKFRKYLDAYIEVPRKNGKSTFMGGIINYMAFSSWESRRGYACYIGASTLDQTEECFKRAAGELMKHSGVLVSNSKNNKQIAWQNKKIIAVSAPKDGKLAHCSIFDEYHQYKGNELVDSIVSGNTSDPESLTLRITTAGTDLHGVCKQERDKCEKILTGVIDNPSYFICIYTPDEGDVVDNVDTWQKVNPNWGVSVDRRLIQSRYDYSKGSAQDMVTFKTKNLNMWVNSLQRWANMDIWYQGCCDYFDDSKLEGLVCYGGLDLASVSDFAALCLDFQDGEDHYQKYMYWVAQERVQELERQLYVPLTQWIEDSYIIATPGPAIDYQLIGDYIAEMRSKYDFRLLAADRWHLDKLVALMPDWFADMTIEFSQGMRAMSPSIQEYERLYLIGKVHSGGNPVQSWMMSCAEAAQDTNGNVKLVKPKRNKSQARIDGVVASIMALDTSTTNNGVNNGLTLEDVDNALWIF